MPWQAGGAETQGERQRGVVQADQVASRQPKARYEFEHARAELCRLKCKLPVRCCSISVWGTKLLVFKRQTQKVWVMV